LAHRSLECQTNSANHVLLGLSQCTEKEVIMVYICLINCVTQEKIVQNESPKKENRSTAHSKESLLDPLGVCVY